LIYFSLTLIMGFTVLQGPRDVVPILILSDPPDDPLPPREVRHPSPRLSVSVP